MKSKIKELLGKSVRKVSNSNDYRARDHNSHRNHNQDHRDSNQDRRDHDLGNRSTSKQNELSDAQLTVIKALEIMEQSQKSMKEEIMKTLRGQ